MAVETVESSKISLRTFDFRWDPVVRGSVCTILVLVFVGSTRGQQDVIDHSEAEDTSVTATYDFNRNGTCPSTDDGINQLLYRLIFSDFSRHGVTCEDGEALFNSREWDAGDYVSFSVRPAGGYQLVFGDRDSLFFWAQRSASAPTDFELTYQVGNDDPEVVKSWTLPGHRTDILFYQADLPELTTTEEVTFAIRATRSGSHWRGTIWFDDVQVQVSSEKETTATSTTSVSEQPGRYRLLENYPNPFNPSTTIPFVLAGPSLLRLTVHDGLGRQVRVLIDRRLPAGRHEVAFDARGLASGTYFVRMDAGAFVATRPLVLIE